MRNAGSPKASQSATTKPRSPDLGDARAEDSKGTPEENEQASRLRKERAARLRALDRKISRWDKEVGGGTKPKAAGGSRARRIEAGGQDSERAMTERLVEIEARLSGLEQSRAAESEAVQLAA